MKKKQWISCDLRVFVRCLFFTIITSCALCIFVLPSSCDTQFKLLLNYDKSKQYYPESVWLKAANPRLMGWNPEKLQIARQYSKSIGSAAIIIIENGVVVDCWGKISFRYKCHSIRKSLINALYGIHIDNGNIDTNKTLGELTINDINPSLTTLEKQAKIADLLKSRSGVYHQAAYETKNMRNNRPAQGSHPSGSFWYYNNWDFNALLTIFEQETDKKIFKEFEDKIAIPLQFEHFNINDTEYYYEKDKSIHPAYLFRMSALDMARFGLLYQRSGLWKEKRILSEKWIKDSTTIHSKFGNNKLITGFGYLWWIGKDHFQASGKGGHRMVIMPKKNLIIVHRVDTEKSFYPKINLKKFTQLYNIILEAKEDE